MFTRSRNAIIVPCLYIIACVFGLLGLTPAAVAQGTMGMLPGPISTIELDDYAQRLRVSAQQRRAMDAVHDHYKMEFRTLRDAEIADFLKSMRQMEESELIPQRKRIEDFVRQMDAIVRRIAALDNRLFDEIQPILTEEQLVVMPRVRLARQRNRLNNMQLVWMGGQAPVDVSAIVAEMSLSDADRAIASDLLGPYESRLTSEMEKMYAGSTKTITGIYDALAGLGFDEQSMQDPDRMEEMGEAMQTVWMNLMIKNTEQLRSVAELNDRTMHTIAAAVSSESARDVRYQYYRRAYPEAGYAMYMHDYVFAPALRRDDLSPQQRESLITIRDEMLRKLDNALERAVANAREWRSSINPFAYDQAQAESYQKKQAELRSECDRIRDEANAALLAALGEDMLNSIGRLKNSHQEAAGNDEQVAMGGDVDDLDWDDDDADAMHAHDDDDIVMDEYAHGFDQFVPPAISPSEFAEIAQIFELTDEQRIVAQDLHQRYMQAFESKNKKEFSELQSVVNSMWLWDEQAQASRSPTELTVTTAYRLRGEAIAAVRRSDNDFFTELEMAVLTPDQVQRLPRARLARDRVAFNRGATHWGIPEASMDVSRLVRRQRTLFTDEQWARIDQELFRYESAVVPMLQKRFERTMDVQKTQEQWQAEAARQRTAGDDNAMRSGIRYGEVMREPQRLLAEVALELSAFNREAIARITAIAEGEAGHTLRTAYNRAAHPTVYNDGGSMEKPLRLARALTDLTPDQSRQLNDLAAQYLPEYAAVCERMVDANAGTGFAQMWVSSDDADDHDWQKHQEILAKLRFDRSEINARAASTLRAVLTEEQLNRIGGLPKIAAPGEFDY